MPAFISRCERSVVSVWFLTAAEEYAQFKKMFEKIPKIRLIYKLGDSDSKINFF